MTASLNPSVQIPSNSVGYAGLDCDCANRANPNFASFCRQAVGLLNLKLMAALNFSLGQRESNPIQIKLFDFHLSMTPALASGHF
jgi:hypothetical protein